MSAFILKQAIELARIASQLRHIDRDARRACLFVAASILRHDLKVANDLLHALVADAAPGSVAQATFAACRYCVAYAIRNGAEALDVAAADQAFLGERQRAERARLAQQVASMPMPWWPPASEEVFA